MHTAVPQTAPRRTATAIAGIAAVVIALGLLAAGGALLSVDGHKDADGFHSTAHEPFATSTYALATDNLDVDLDGAGWIIDRAGLGNVRIDVRPRAGKPVFVGIAPTRDVSAYLSGTSHTSIADVSYSPFRASHRDRGGERAPARPADQRFWAASAHGTGPQTLAWEIEDGDWSVVVMNADASRAVAADVSAAAKAPILGPAGWMSIGSGLLLLVTAVALVAVPAVRRRSHRTAHPIERTR